MLSDVRDILWRLPALSTILLSPIPQIHYKQLYISQVNNERVLLPSSLPGQKKSPFGCKYSNTEEIRIGSLLQ